MKGKVKCTCGWEWNKSDSSKKDMYICHECGRDNSNNMQNGGWLDSYADGGTMQEHQENYNDYEVSAPEGFKGNGYSNVGRNYSPAWGGQFQEGGEIPNAQNGKKKPIYKKNKVQKIEKRIDNFLGKPQQRAMSMADISPNEDPVDNIRHSFAGRYTQDAIAKKLGNGPIANIAGLAGSNLMGAAHELSTIIKDDRSWLTKLRESGEDMVNNAVGSVIGAIPFMGEKAKDKMMYKMSYGNLLPDGYVSTEKSKKKRYSDNMYFKNKKGKVDREYQMGGNIYPVNYVPQAQDGLQTVNSRQKRGLDLLIKETKKAKEDEKELRTTGQVKYPKSIKYKKQKKELDKKQTYLTQDNRSEAVKNYDEAKGREKEFKKIIKPVIQAADLTTDLMQLGIFVPHPIGQAIGEIGNVAGAAIDAYEAADDVSEGNYGSAAINAGSAILPMFLEGSGYTRDMYNTNPGSLADDIASLGNRSGNYIPLTTLPHAVAPSTIKGVNFNRALLGTLGAESVYDIPEFQTGGSIPGSVGFSYARIGAPSKGPRRNQTDVTDASAQDGKEVDMYGNPIIAKQNHRYDIDRSYYDPRKNIINLGADYASWANKDKLLAHENYHAKQHEEGRDNFDIGHNTENRQWAEMQKRPEIMSTPEVWNNFYNRKGIESDMSTSRIVERLPESQFFRDAAGDIIYNKIVDPTQYDIPYSFEGEAQYYEDNGVEFQNGGEMRYYQNGLDWKPKSISQNGSIVKDDNGYWNPDNWGKPVEIGSNDITMEGVYEPLLGVSDTGDTKLMEPGKNYKFKGNKVTEYPVAKNGKRQEQKGLVNLDNLTNFTNYNTKQPGGWLDTL